MGDMQDSLLECPDGSDMWSGFLSRLVGVYNMAFMRFRTVAGISLTPAFSLMVARGWLPGILYGYGEAFLVCTAPLPGSHR
jgi:hypothetical protein